MAKIIVPDGSADVKVGTLVAITVDEEGDVAAFKNYVSSEAKVASPPVAAQLAAPVPVKVTPPVSAPQPVVQKKVEVLAAPRVVPVAAPTLPSTGITTPLKFQNWGKRAFSSPLANKLLSLQKDYELKYGLTLQVFNTFLYYYTMYIYVFIILYFY